MLGGEGLLRRTQAKQSRCLHTETLPMSLAIMLGGARPVASDPELPMVGARVASTCGDDPSRQQPPSRFRPGFALAASHGRPIGARRRR